MSSFFRNASEVTESEETSGYSDSSSSNARSIANELVTRSQGAAGASQHHQNVLVHALLEDKCLNDVCHELNATRRTGSSRYTKADPDVRTRAAERYRLLTAQLVSHGLISAGPEDDSFQNVRQTARDGLTMLSQQLNAMELSTEDANALVAQDRPRIGQPTRRLLEAPAEMTSPWKTNAFVPTPLSQPRNLHLAQLLPSHPLLDSTRYSRDFEEICMLGKGGYGSVYHASHRLDGRSYAVKKVRLGPEVLSRVQQNGESELDAILRELRTMARLEHPNIVRYFGGWVEWTRESDLPGSSSATGQPRLITQGTQSSTSASVSSLPSSPRPVAVSEDGILFADTVSRSRDPRSPPRAPLLADEAIEEISRPSPTAPPPSPGPSLTLHIQMSLYPLTLATYLTGTPRHCFHRSASLALFSSILAGVAHLHANGIAHRDIKPANVFMAPLGVPSGCPGCAPWAVCVGDLGLVAEAGARSGGVGTALYRPTAQGGAREQDFFALAVVLVELCTPFGTRMERGEALGRLREGVLPDELGKTEGGIVRALMGLDGEERVSAEGVRVWVEDILKGL